MSPASPNTRVRFVINLTSSVRKKHNFPTTAAFTKSHGTCAQQKRSLSTVILKERRFLYRPQEEFLSSLRAYVRNSIPDPPPYLSKTAYYDTLQVPMNATHAQIKTAYYKQSFIYHPDKNAGSEEAATRFAEITEAYNVLGNKTLKRKYDRGILSHADVQGAGRPPAKETPSSSAASSEQKGTGQSLEVGMRGKSVFDFDEFFRAHYSEQLQREKDVRLHRENIKKSSQSKQDFLSDVTSGLLVILALAVVFSMRF